MTTHDDAVGASEDVVFELAWDGRFRPLLALIGVRPANSRVVVGADRLVARFGPWTCETPLSNVRCVQLTGPYRWFKAIGPRGSWVDRGLTFGTTTRGGVCVELREPVPGLLPSRRFLHPGLTFTVADREGLGSLLRTRCGLGPVDQS